MSRVLFVCLRNAGRSQISRALFDRRVADGRHKARSAGTTPADAVHPEVVEAMAEVEIDLSHQRPTQLTRDLAEWADIVVTMGCGDACPYVPGKRYIDWQLDDPADQPLGAVRLVRDEIERRIDKLVDDLDQNAES
ncbi:MAG: arsenate reductase ArsC [Solirubrobacterales bacterium]|nr:arsenate reductase ArsC [Solirubrobacterales bacterium]OJU93369.1 MAG: heat-shock protein HtpX [Solirubrobacterales bacterium 67-14]